MKNIRKSSFAVITAFVLVGGFLGYRIVQAVGGQGTATIDGGAPGGNVSVVQSTSHVFTVVLTVGVSGITADALNPTFTIPAGFTAPNGTPVANVGSVIADGQWFATAAGGTCTVNTPNANLTVASGHVITVDVTTTCATGHTPPDTITLTYQGQSASTMVVAPLNIGTAVDASQQPSVILISAPPTITVTAASATLIVKKVVNNDNGGTLAVEDFSFSVNGDTAQSFEVDGQNDLSVDAGTYTITEPATAGYTTSYDNCSDLDIPSGGSETCTITNNDIAPASATLHIIKTLINDSGGTSNETDFSFSINDGTAQAFEADGQNDLTLDAGTYTVTEPATAGYSTSYDNCSDLDIPSGGSETCTITNDDILQAVSDEDEDEDEDEDVAIKVKKTANPSTLSGPGSVTYTYKVTNEGDVSLKKISVKDDKCSSVKYVSGDSNHNSRLGLDEEWKYACTKKVSATETNKVTAKGTGNGERVKDTDRATVVVSAPGFPNAGIGGNERNNLWDRLFLEISLLFHLSFD